MKGKRTLDITLGTPISFPGKSIHYPLKRNPVMKKILILWMCILLSAAPALADTELNDRERVILGGVLNTLYQQSKDLEFLGEAEAAARLDGLRAELKNVVFWKEATGPIDTPRVLAGRLLSGETDCAYRLRGAGENLYLRDCFFNYHAPEDTPRGKLDRLEQAAMLIHENMHLNHGAGEKEAYIEEYRWLRTFGVNSDYSVDWVLQADGKTKGECATMKNVLTKLKDLGVSIDELEKEIAPPRRLARAWSGFMMIERTPYADDQLSKIPAEARKFVAMMFPARGTKYNFILNVERKGPNNSIGKIAGVPGQGGTIEIEMHSLGPAEEKVRAYQLYEMPGPSDKKKDLQYFWDGWVKGDRAYGTWEAFLVGGGGPRVPCYSGSWAVERAGKPRD